MEEKGRTQAKRPLLSVVVPCYNEEEALPLCYQALCEVAEQMPQVQFEFWLIDDGSSDRTSDVMRALRGQDARVHYVLFSRNFGKEAALYAGLEQARGDYVCVLDADLQDPPSLLPQMYAAIVQEG